MEVNALRGGDSGKNDPKMALSPWKFLGSVALLTVAGFGGGYWLGSRTEELKKFDKDEVHHVHPVVTPNQLSGVEIVGENPRVLRLSTETMQSLSIKVAAARPAPI